MTLSQSLYFREYIGPNNLRYKGEEMTQTLYVGMNKRKLRYRKKTKTKMFFTKLLITKMQTSC
jgi:hypothetical protein